MDKWKIITSELVLDNKWIKVRRDSCILPSGVLVEDYYLCLGNDFVIVFGLTEDERVLLVRQYKHGANDIVLELPAGVIDQDDHTPLSAVARELKEETGYAASSYIPLGELFVSSAKATTVAHCYLATGLVRVSEPRLDPQEDIEIELMPVAELLNMIRDGIVRDANSIATTFLSLDKLGRLEVVTKADQENTTHVNSVQKRQEHRSPKRS